jgi:tetratricopeptide (TPR) repeat protein
MPQFLRWFSRHVPVLVLVLGGLGVGSQAAAPPSQATLYPVPGGRIGHVELAKDLAGTWWLDFTYTYTPPTKVEFSLALLPRPEDAPASWDDLAGLKDFVPQPGTHDVRLPLQYPGEPTEASVVEMRMWQAEGERKLIASYWVKQTIVWKDPASERARSVDSPEERLKIAIALLDGCDDEGFSQARTIVEDLIRKDPTLVQAHVELARAIMKTNWSEEGLAQAEQVLGMAQRISPTDANTQILLGYVYTNQGRLEEAERLFKAAAKANPPNLWLWTNWGDLLVLQGDKEGAIPMYRRSVSHAKSNDSCDMARVHAFERLIRILEPAGDSEELLGLYNKRYLEYGIGRCYGTALARYLVRVRGDVLLAAQRMDFLKGHDCDDEEEREVIGQIQYVLWSRAGAGGDAALDLARVHLPVGARTLFLLAGSPHTLPALRRLKESGTSIDIADRYRNTALAIALSEGDHVAAEALVRLGADPVRPVGEARLPVALIPVLVDDAEGVSLMRRLGVDYAQVSHDGVTALDIARQSGDAAMLQALGGSYTGI